MSTELTASGLALTSLLLCGGGVGALRVGWRRSDMLGRLAPTAGWVLLAAAIYIGVQAWGAEFGITYVLAAFSLIALMGVALNIERRPVVPDKGGIQSNHPSSTWQKWLTFLIAGPLIGLVSCQLTLLCASALPGSEVSNMATAAIVFPTLWGVLSYLSCLVGNSSKQAVVLTVIAVATSLALYI